MHPFVKLAVALKYEHDVDVAPLVLATGKNSMAEALIHKAQELGIPIHADTGLAQTLVSVPVGAMVPEDLYPVIAQILAMVYSMDASLNPTQRDVKAELDSPDSPSTPSIPFKYPPTKSSTSSNWEEKN